VTPQQKDRLDKFCVVFGMAHDIDPNLVKRYVISMKKGARYDWYYDRLRSEEYFYKAVNDSPLDQTPEQVHAKLISQLRQKLILRR
jgi:hypothetical protein